MQYIRALTFLLIISSPYSCYFNDSYELEEHYRSLTINPDTFFVKEYFNSITPKNKETILASVNFDNIEKTQTYIF